MGAVSFSIGKTESDGQLILMLLQGEILLLVGQDSGLPRSYGLTGNVSVMAGDVILATVPSSMVSF